MTPTDANLDGHVHPPGHEHEHHDHGHHHHHGDEHGHEHPHHHDDHVHGASESPAAAQDLGHALALQPAGLPVPGSPLIVLRTPSGLSGDMLVAGLARLADASNADLAALLSDLKLPALDGGVSVQPHAVIGISGWKAHVRLPTEHAHRTFGEIAELLERSTLTPPARQLATHTFRILAKAEARVHGIDIDRIAFHEVGALDSILDIGLASALYTHIGAAGLHCSPLPLCDGNIRCEHGLLASPAPAVQEMLTDVPVYGIASRGETVTPTALAFLRGVGAVFGPWPALRVSRTARVYGGRVLPNVPNGALFVLGTP